MFGLYYEQDKNQRVYRQWQYYYRMITLNICVWCDNQTLTIETCPKCTSPKIRFILDYEHVLLNRKTESLWVCDNCYYRFRAKYEFKKKRGPTTLTKAQMHEEISD